jgi:hypothetical protein
MRLRFVRLFFFQQLTPDLHCAQILKVKTKEETHTKTKKPLYFVHYLGWNDRHATLFISHAQGLPCVMSQSLPLLD